MLGNGVRKGLRLVPNRPLSKWCQVVAHDSTNLWFGVSHRQSTTDNFDYSSVWRRVVQTTFNSNGVRTSSKVISKDNATNNQAVYAQVHPSGIGRRLRAEESVDRASSGNIFPGAKIRGRVNISGNDTAQLSCLNQNSECFRHNDSERRRSSTNKEHSYTMRNSISCRGTFLKPLPILLRDVNYNYMV